MVIVITGTIIGDTHCISIKCYKHASCIYIYMWI